MCDYSLEHQVSRAAVLNDRVVSSGFPNTATRGFSPVGDPALAVCLLPGTELVFDQPILRDGVWANLLNRFRPEPRLARFRQINQDNAVTHHDALELANGRIVPLTHLRRGQTATVIQLPVGTQRALVEAMDLPLQPVA